MWGTRIRIGSTLIALALLLAGGCGGEERPPGEVALAPTGAKLDDHRWLGEPLTLGNLTVWPVYTDRPLDVGEFLTLEEAEQRKVAEVREVGAPEAGQAIDLAAPELVDLDEVADEPERSNAAGNDDDANEPAAQQEGRIRLSGRDGQVLIQGGGAVVNTLVIENQGDLPILVCAGTIVKGGQQDRQIAQDFVIAAKTSVPVDAFCVEPGRWSFRAGGDAAFCSLGQGVAPKSVRASGQYEKDQGKVWAEVHKVLAENEIAGTTTLVAANEDVADETIARRDEQERRVVEHFARLAERQASPVGFAYAVDGKPVTVRAFAHPRLLAGHLPAFVKAMCLEAELAERARGDAPAPAPASAEDVVALVKGLAEAEARREQTRASNWNLYRTSDAAFGGACVLPHVGPDTVIVTEDWTAK